MESARAPAVPRISLRRKLLFVLGIWIAFLVALEVGFRLLSPVLGVPEPGLQRIRDMIVLERKLGYEADAHTVFRLSRQERGVNPLGFRTPEIPVEKPPGTLRISCLGASTTYGHGVQWEEAYPHLLEVELRQRTGAEIEVMNWGVSGWTTAESMVNYFLNVQDYDSDVVIVHHAMNDVEPRIRDGFQADYSHYRKAKEEKSFPWWQKKLVRYSDLYTYFLFRVLRSVTIEALANKQSLHKPLTPETTEPFARNLISICDHVKAHGGRPFLMTMPVSEEAIVELQRQGVDIAVWEVKSQGTREHNQILRELAVEHGYGLLDLERDWSQRTKELQAYFTDPVHVDAEGNRLKAAWIADRLLAEDLFRE